MPALHTSFTESLQLAVVEAVYHEVQQALIWHADFRLQG